jgi:ATP synthase protein I
MNTQPKSMLSEALRDLMPYTSLGWQLVATILLFFGIGYGLDLWWGTKPVLTVIGAVVGVVAGLFSFIRTALSLTQRSKRETQ